MRNVFKIDKPLASPGAIQLPSCKSATYSVGFLCQKLQIHPELIARAAIALDIRPIAVDNIAFFEIDEVDRMIAWLKEQTQTEGSNND